MRKSREELLAMFPSWNEKRSDIVKTLYGDEPLYTAESFWYKNYLEGYGRCPELDAVEATDAVIFDTYGEFDKYQMLAGEIITEHGNSNNPLCGKVYVELNGRTYDVIMNRMYGKQALTILYFGSSGTSGFSNKDGQRVRLNCKELSKRVIEKVLTNSMEDYGEPVRRFLEVSKELYDMDQTNYIMD